MNKNTFKKIALEKGGLHIYDFGTVRLHAYQTNDPINNEVFILEKDGNAVFIESPCFFDNNQELQKYAVEKKWNVAGMLLAYHMAGGTFLPGVRKYATENAEQYGHKGGGKALIDNFAGVFGESFDSALHTVTDPIGEGKITVGGMDFIIAKTADAFDIEIPEINGIYTHMLGHDCHSIVAGPAHADALISQLTGYLEKGYTLVLTSHYTPEDLKDVETKIAYLKELKKIAAECGDAETFQTAVKKRYSDYAGENYLEMTAGFFFG